ncbi:UNVERIFIED_CONTAM: Cytochrome c oxidase subunitb-1 [Sesamum calycinum]|uniref:Cytochrome c oxidase subunitb-1 n=1 Tax=Sesamum calycinum TaxID=2727403 RepID=A0AAW2RS99_9LAMI
MSLELFVVILLHISILLMIYCEQACYLFAGNELASLCVVRCIATKGEGSSDCGKFARYYRSLCPGEWIERWNEQRENGTFPGPL